MANNDSVKRKPGRQPGLPKIGGRKKGTPNKLPPIREAFLQALNEVGGVAWLVKMANEHPVAFLAAITRLLPRQDLEIDGDTRRVLIIERSFVGLPQNGQANGSTPLTIDVPSQDRVLTIGVGPHKPNGSNGAGSG